MNSIDSLVHSINEHERLGALARVMGEYDIADWHDGQITACELAIRSLERVQVREIGVS